MHLSLKKRKQLLPILFILALLFVLSLIIILGQFFHQTLQDEMAEQFNKLQLMLAREIAINIESFVDRLYKDIHTIAQLPEIARIHNSPRCRVGAEAITSQLQSDVPVAIQVLTKNGRILYDNSAPEKEGMDLSGTAFFK